MLEVKNIFREYHPKKGVPVVALNYVDLKFPDHGLIFILGKSGSGKSTLLNVMGGLDKADSGEILIKGKSSRDFKQSDFDSYRNTYIGFIFQEYNILDEFNVGQNIALAIQLQGRKATNEEINKILSDVDMNGYGNRKPNELSGGQKQRVAIARALVKNPEIIFADEPTGALDSKTGIAVFDTLKKLSADKLVVVVSHDREFAEMYGDRVIELSDGNVISDIEKTKISGDNKSDGITVIDEKVLKIKKGYDLTSKDMEIIMNYLNSTKDERIISLDEKTNENVRHIARIDEVGNKESFKKTDEKAIVNKPGKFQSIRSKLSLKHCFRIGSSSLKVKPIRLFITILLSIVAFGMFGLSDTMGSYEKVNATMASLNDSNNNHIAFSTNLIAKSGDYKYFQGVNAKEDDVTALKDKYGLDIEKIYAIDSSNNNFENYLNNFLTNQNNSLRYYSNFISGMYVSSNDKINEKGFDLLYGNYPINTNEIAITKHTYDTFKKFGYRSYSGTVQLEASEVSYETLVNNDLIFYKRGNQINYKITGIIDTHFDKSNYEKLKNSEGNSSIGLYMLSNQYRDECIFGYHTLLFTNQSTIDKSKENSHLYIDGEVKIDIDENTFYFYSINEFKSNNKILLKNNQNTLSDNEYVLNISTIRNIISSNNKYYEVAIEPYELTLGTDKIMIDNLATLINYTEINNYIHAFAYDNFDDAISNGMDLNEIYQNIYNSPLPADYTRKQKIWLYTDYIRDSLNYIEPNVNFYANVTLYNYAFNIIKQLIKPYLDIITSSIKSPKISLMYYDKISNEYIHLMEYKEFKIVGIDFESNNSNSLSLNTEMYNSFTASAGDYLFLLTSKPNDQKLLRRIIEDSYKGIDSSDERVYCLESEVMPAFNSINSTVESLSKVFFWLGIGFAVFASLMLFNFITISITYKKREIGILRAVGARSNDVFKIFFSESFIIAIISYIFSILVTFVVSNVINVSLKSGNNLAITILSPGFRQIVLILAVCIFVAFISTTLPVYKIAMKRPIDAIQNR